MRHGLILAALALFPLSIHAAPAETGKPVDIVVCLDTSNSMDGLIDSAKRKLWAIVNDLAKVEPTPVLRVALYSYGNTGYDAAKGWVRKDLDLTTDLDDVYRHLNALTTNGGEEYVARVTRDAIRDLKWSTDKDALRLIFVCGNEPADQDKQVTLVSVAAQAKEHGVIINTIYCGPATHPETQGWKDFAKASGGKYANIDQDKSKAEVAIKSPFDEELQKLSTAINKTYVCYGERGAEGKANQAAQDANALKAAPGAALDRAATKAGKLYSNSSWDLIDRMNTEKGFDLKKLKEEELPEELRKMKPEERLTFLTKKAAERVAIQKTVAELAAKRAKFIDDERKKLPKNEADKSFDDALKIILREQAATKGMTIKN